jgi:hypothetical protein
VADIYRYLKRKGYAFEILIIINGCTDKTLEIARALSISHKQVKVLISKQGYGLALRKGLKEAKGEFIAIFNVDYYNLHLLDLADIEMYGRDMIIGSKRTFWAEDNRPLVRKTISLLFNLFLRLAFGFKGSDTHGIKLLRKEIVEKILPMCKTKSDIFYTELIIRAQRAGYKLADFPVAVNEKRPTRFTFVDRTLRTPLNIYKLYRALKKD